MQTTTIVSPKVSRAIGVAFTAVGAYTPPTSAVIAGLVVCNIVAAVIKVTVTVFDGANDTNLVFSRPVAIGDSLILGGDILKAALVNGWNIRVKSDTATSCDATLFVVEAT